MTKLCRRSLLIGATIALGAPLVAATASTEASEDIAVNTAMPTDRFWSLIEQTLPFKDNQQKQVEALRRALVALPPKDIEAFDIAFQAELIRSYTWDLWGAAYVIHGGASDDGFEYFRRWLISRGRTLFEQALADPDSLANAIPKNTDILEFEEFGYVARDAWCEVTGKDGRDFAKGVTYPAYPKTPAGTPFEEDDAHLAKRYPKLWARFGENPLG